MDKKLPSCILIADNDSRLCEMLSLHFQEHGFATKIVSNEDEMNFAMERACFALIVLDLMLPGTGSLSICRRLRRNENNIPILILTAKGNGEDCMAGLEAGANDYMEKPFDPRDLFIRAQAVIRRQPAILPGAPDTHDNLVEFGHVRVNLGTRTFFRDHQEILITTGEFSLLKVLLQNPRLPLSRDKLMELSRRREHGVYDRTIDVQISRLRKLVEDNPGKPRYIQTVWGFGYVFVPDGGSPPSFAAD